MDFREVVQRKKQIDSIVWSARMARDRARKLAVTGDTERSARFEKLAAQQERKARDLGRDLVAVGWK